MDDIIVQEYPQGTAWVHRQRGALDAGARAALWAWLEAEERPRFARGVTAEGKPMGRAMRWYHETKEKFGTRWAQEPERWRAAPYPPALRALQARAQALAQRAAARHAPHRPFVLRGCLANRYDHERDHIPMHRLARHPRPVIVAFSLGAPRVLEFQPLEYDPERPRAMKPRRGAARIRCALEAGDALLMGGTTQLHYAHGIPPAGAAATGARYSLTFRE